MTYCRFLAGILGLGLPGLIWGDCATLAADIQNAARAGEVTALADYARQIPTEPSCADDFRVNLARVAAYGFLRVVQGRLAKGATLADQEPLLRQSLTVARTWQVLALLGDLELERKHYEVATLTYQEALGLINDPVATPKAPPEAQIESIFRKAAESRLLAERYVAVPVNHRSGTAEGLALTSVRGWAVQRVPIPVTFESYSAQFSPKGEQAASDLAAYLLKQAPAEITLVGHTDERGSDQENLALSIRRAEVLAKYLKDQGYGGRIRIEGAGESQPIKLDDPDRYTQEEIWELNRRVELVRK
ncbi:MAG: OmpA family protein [Chromatiaceae bacterium]|nr:OmpA family protein [Chromatiaceae bacterium]